MILTTPCIEYDGFRNANGYGRVNKRVGGKLISRYVHRTAWEQANGPIPAGMIVMHLCDNPPCYRLDHLRLGTHEENRADMLAKGRYKGGSNAPSRPPAPKPGPLAGRTHCKHGHEYTPANTCIQPKTGWRSCRKCRRDSDRRRRSGVAVRS
jgi:hypothetical protein